MQKKAASGTGRRFSLRCSLGQAFGFVEWVLLSDALAPEHANAEEVEPTITKTTMTTMILDTDHLLSRVDEAQM